MDQKKKISFHSGITPCLHCSTVPPHFWQICMPTVSGPTIILKAKEAHSEVFMANELAYFGFLVMNERLCLLTASFSW